MSNLQLNNLEALWRQYQLLLHEDSDLSVTDFASKHPEFESEILKLFPMMKDLAEYAKDPIGTPEKIGNYKIIRQIGIGGMGVVYEASSESLHERIAIKVVEQSLLASNARNRLEREAKVAATLHHSNIVPVYEFGQIDNNHFYTMQFIDGPNLSEVLHQDSCDFENELSANERRAREIAKRLAENWNLQLETIGQVASALEYAHAKGVLHRDVKPANLLVDESLKIWVTDFGLAKLRADDQRLTVQSKVMGTPRYMAPEQIRGEADERSDIFGLGLTLYEMLLLRKKGQNCRQPIWKGGLQPPSDYNPAIPMILDRIVMKAVSLDPETRYQTVSKFIEDLEQARDELSSYQPRPDMREAEAYKDSWIEPSNRFAEIETSTKPEFKKRLAFSAVTIGCFFIVGLLALPWLLEGHQTRTEPVLENPGELSDQQKSNIGLLTGVASDNSVSKHAESTDKLIGNNRPPSFAEHMFEADGATIRVVDSKTSFPTALEINDDQHRVFDGLYCSISSGADRELFVMTPPGIFAFSRPISASQPIDANRDNIYELEVSVSDNTQAYFVRLRQKEDDSYYLVRDTLTGGSKFDSKIICENLRLPPGIMDIATADGKTFFHIHRNQDDTVALFKSQITADQTLKTERLSSNCGLSSNVIGFATIDGRSFKWLRPERGQKVSLYTGSLLNSGTFEANVSLEKSFLKPHLSGFSWLDDNRFQHLQKTQEQNDQFYFSFLKSNRFIQMPLSDGSEYADDKQPSLGFAAWVDRKEDSNTTYRTLRIKVDAD